MPETILVTGANSFIAGWIIKYLLDEGYHVRGTVRNKEKELKVLNGISKDDHHRVSFVHIGDIANDSFDEAVENVHGIIHVASPFHFNITDPEKDLLLPAINGTTGILKAAHQYNQKNSNQIQRIIITSSFGAIVDPTKGFRPNYSYTENDWCPLTYEQAVAGKADPGLVYRASKVCAERAAWDFIEKEKVSFTLATICEPMVFGPRIDGFKSLDDINTSNAIIWSLITNGKDAQIPETRVPMEIDVRDVAFTHVAALKQSRNTNERYLIAAGSWSHQAIVDIIHSSDVISEQIKNITPIGTKGQQLPDHYQIDSSKAQQQLNTTYIPVKNTIEDLVLQLAQLKELLGK